jgi:hypothetical protein
MFENRKLRRLFGLRKEKITGGWRKLHKEGLQDLYQSFNMIRVIK